MGAWSKVTQIRRDFIIVQWRPIGFVSLVLNLGEAAPNSSQSPGLVEANSAAISYDRKKRRDSIQDLLNHWSDKSTLDPNRDSLNRNSSSNAPRQA